MRSAPCGEYNFCGNKIWYYTKIAFRVCFCYERIRLHEIIAIKPESMLLKPNIWGNNEYTERNNAIIVSRIWKIRPAR